MSMYVHPTRDFQVPILKRSSNDNEIVVENLKGLDYTRRRAIPAIRHYVTIPFEEGLVENTRSEAGKEEKLGLEGILKEKHTTRFNPGTEIMIDTTIFPDTIVEYKKVLDEFNSYLNIILFERSLGLRRDNIRSKRNESYIQTPHAERIIKHIHNTHARKEESKLITLRDSETEEKIEPQERGRISITLDKEHNKSLSSDNLMQYYNSLEIVNSLKSFMIDFKKYYMSRNNINLDSLDSKVQRDYPLSKGGIVRMLFYPQREIDYRQSYHEIAGNPRNKLVPDTGDIDILALLPDQDDIDIKALSSSYTQVYSHRKDESLLKVDLSKNKARITRERKSHGPTIETYNILIHDDKIFISVRDIISRIERTIVDNTQRKIRLKVDPILPEPRFKR